MNLLKINLDFNKQKFPCWKDIRVIIFDFDGIFTDNKVFVDQNGTEFVCCNRADGLGIDLLRKFKEKMNWELDYFIVSTEKNKVVSQRANKLKIDCYQNVKNKREFLINFLKSKFDNYEETLRRTIYLGNDLNDLNVMDIAEYFIAPKNAHPIIKKNADIIIDINGGEGFVRYFIEKIILLDEFDKLGLEDLV